MLVLMLRRVGGRFLEGIRGIRGLSWKARHGVFETCDHSGFRFGIYGGDVKLSNVIVCLNLLDLRYD